ncbi:hypothetical protein KY284_008222 [Solanum tuberosum]|nr:hypothetical protein KY284_008222 [Solanum tuberosum]
MARDSCLARVTAGVAIGGAVGGAVVSIQAEVISNNLSTFQGRGKVLYMELMRLLGSRTPVNSETHQEFIEEL